MRDACWFRMGPAAFPEQPIRERIETAAERRIVFNELSLLSRKLERKDVVVFA